MTIRIHDRVIMVDRYAARAQCTCKHKTFEPSWFNGLKGVVTRVSPTPMVLLVGERLPMVFDERDLVVLDDEQHVTGGWVMTHRHADSDRPGWRTLMKRRQADRDFLAGLHLASLDELRTLSGRYGHKDAPQWKRVAIDRAIARVEGT